MQPSLENLCGESPPLIFRLIDFLPPSSTCLVNRRRFVECSGTAALATTFGDAAAQKVPSWIGAVGG
ncbi:Uncharacterised protein [Mycobacteroides abscessus subsp. bolletii]|nr:Uncharacterised protein [Mycobacteroides abscessus subsp. bolletii]SKP67938.1 Uncharacterised protein [Mycobacteroides abscessus subsp. bolletii]SKP69387.1 Uncharacterised protein [Mycobacteroides abscessus subsp. bolletii]SKQ27839.1 Uncharacterised protein [Mycobacteroides abscessus subsp. bolletii]